MGPNDLLDYLQVYKLTNMFKKLHQMNLNNNILILEF